MELKALIFDSYFDKHRGVIAYIRVFNGEVKSGDKAYFLATGFSHEVNEVGIFAPDLTKAKKLSEGEVGYIITGTKDVNLVKVGDTVTLKDDQNLALPGYKEIEPKVYSSIFPIDQGDYPKLKDAMSKIKLSDASLRYDTESIPALGFGFRCGFLGLLHMDIIQQRLSREFDLDLIMSTPSVQYEITKTNGETELIHNPSELPDPSQLSSISEPWIKMEIITPEEYLGNIMAIITSHRGSYNRVDQISEGQLQVVGEVPLAEVIVDFYDELKSMTKGYATVSYEQTGFRPGDLIKLDFLVNHEVVPPLSTMIHRENASSRGKQVCEKLAKLIPRQQFQIAIQAAIGGKIIARDNIKSFRKDVTAKLYGGDMTRRRKLLDKQKKGKKKMKMIGNVEIPQSVFLGVLKK